MKHYEIVLLVHPDQSDQVPSMMERYRELIESHQGTLHRFEDWGRRQLAYAIRKVHKAHYLLLNIEIPGPVLTELESLFRFNDAVLRSLVVALDEAVTEPSPMARSKEEGEQGSRRGRRSAEGGDDRHEPRAESTRAATESPDAADAEIETPEPAEDPAPA